jgi:hypothetical protein
MNVFKRKYFEVWGNEEAQNVFLKGMLVIVSVLFVVQSIALTIVAFRKPVLVAVGASETRVFNVTPPGDELLSQELKRVLLKYTEAHYNWTSSNVEKAHAEAARYVSAKFVKAFNSANAGQIQTAREKKISQRVYPSSEILVDTKSLSARIQMDRIFSVEGISATRPITLDMTFEYGPRTSQNPEGIYITDEKLVAEK